MKSKTLWRLTITTTLEAEEAVSELLGRITNESASAHFDVETQVSVVSVFGSRSTILAAGVRERVASGLKQIKSCGLNTGSGRIIIAKVRNEDWSESWKRHFKAIKIGGVLLIKPSWIKRPPRKNQAVVILDPGLSFGTGQHATTSFCLHQIVAVACYRRSRCPQSAATTKSFLDIGTGSGILAIAAAKLGFKTVHAFDFDLESVRVARANACMNLVTGKIKIAKGDVVKLPLRSIQKYDLICANLISNLLVAERRRIVAQLNRGGTLVLAGILKSEFSKVQAAFEVFGLKLIAAKSEKEWRSGAFQFSAK